MSNWVPASIKPPDRKFVLCTDGKFVFEAQYVDDIKQFMRAGHPVFFTEITHWTPLPDPPELPEYYLRRGGRNEN